MNCYGKCPKCWENKFKRGEFMVYCVFYDTVGGDYLDRIYVFKHEAENRVEQLQTGKPLAYGQYYPRTAWIVEARGVSTRKDDENGQ